MQMFEVLQSHLRPADNTKCFYCHSVLGDYHKPECVLITKKVMVRCVIEYEITCPNSWDKNDIEFHRNEGSWCADNMLDELARIAGEGECLCHHAKFEVIGTADDKEPFILI